MRSSLPRRHAQRGVEPHHLAVEIGIVDHVHRQRGELVGMAEPARKRNRRGELNPAPPAADWPTAASGTGPARWSARECRTAPVRARSAASSRRCRPSTPNRPIARSGRHRRPPTRSRSRRRARRSTSGSSFDISAVASRSMLKEPIRLTLITLSKSASGIGPSRPITRLATPMPAQLTSTRAGPWAFAAAHDRGLGRRRVGDVADHRDAPDLGGDAFGELGIEVAHGDLGALRRRAGARSRRPIPMRRR